MSLSRASSLRLSPSLFRPEPCPDLSVPLIMLTVDRSLKAFSFPLNHGGDRLEFAEGHLYFKRWGEAQCHGRSWTGPWNRERAEAGERS